VYYETALPVGFICTNKEEMINNLDHRRCCLEELKKVASLKHEFYDILVAFEV
jgi:hypothetical protein